MNIYEKIDKEMEARNIDRKTLCKETGISYSTFTSMYNRRSRNIAMGTVVTLAGYFNVPIDYLLKDDYPLNTIDESLSSATVNDRRDYEDTPTQRRLILVARKAENLEEEERETLIKHFEESVDLYLKAKKGGRKD